jgi:hypothetical protein
MVSVATAILTAADRTKLTFALGGPLPVVAVFGHLWLIPRLGAVGASLVTALTACLGAFAGMSAVYYHWRIFPPAATWWRSIVLTVLVYLSGSLLPAVFGLWLVLKLLLIGLAIPVALRLLGEFSPSEIALVRATLRWRTVNALTDNLYSTASQSLIDYLYLYYNAAPQQAAFFTMNNLTVPARHFHAVGRLITTLFSQGERTGNCATVSDPVVTIWYMPLRH